MKPRQNRIFNLSDLSYADGKFWLVYTDVKITEGAFKDMVNYITTAEDIRLI